MLLADYVFQFLADRGTSDVFMISGGGAMFLNDGLGKEKRIRKICNHHEQGAAIAAEGYARVSGKTAVVSVTTGPGGTNTLTGVIGQWLDSIPALFISGQVKFPTTIASQPELPLRQLGDQEINIVDIVRSVTKYAVMVTDPQMIRYELEKALSIAESGRKGPVWLDIPINVQSTDIVPETLPGYDPEPENPGLAAETVSQIYELLQNSKAPVIVAGHGIRLAGAVEKFRELAEILQIPVLGTFGGFDLLPDDSPLAAGRIGTIGNRAGNIVLQNADCVLCIGTRNNIRQVSYNYENFAKNAEHLICVDIDAAELKKHTVTPTLPVHADAGEFIAKLLGLAVKDHRHEAWLNWSMQWKKRYPAVLDEYCQSDIPGIQPYVFTGMLTRMLPENAVVACTNATPSICLFQAGIVKNGQRMFANSGCASMGYGLPAALGAATAADGRMVVCLEGDGSIMMNLQELQTIRHNNFPVKLFLYNNNEYTSIRQTQDNFFKGRHTGCDNASGVDYPDWQILSKAFNWRYYCIDSIAAAEKLLPEILACTEPVFCEVRLTAGYIFSPKLSSKVMPDGKIISPSLEDMYPFLSESEMREIKYSK